MSLKYIKRIKPAINHHKAAKEFIASIELKNTLHLKDLIPRIVSKSSLTSSDIVAVMDALNSELCICLRDGYGVCFDHFGTFYPYLKSATTNDPIQLKGKNVKYGGVHFRVCKELKNKACCNVLEQTFNANRLLGSITLEQRRIILQKTLQKQNEITATEYAQITHLNIHSTSRDLKRFIKEGWLIRRGTRALYYYSLKKL